MKYIASSGCVLALFWLGISGHYSPLMLCLGAASLALVLLVSHRMNVLDRESQPLHLLGRELLGYYAWLAGRLVVSNIDVVRRIWRGGRAIDPAVASLTMLQESDLARVVFANSITLTPGTVAMGLRGDTVLVHALTVQGIEDLQAGEMNRRVARLERVGRRSGAAP